jgi:hypothetical protein
MMQDMPAGGCLCGEGSGDLLTLGEYFKKRLTYRCSAAIINIVVSESEPFGIPRWYPNFIFALMVEHYGELSEWLKEHAWKACIRGNLYREFESLTLRHFYI